MSTTFINRGHFYVPHVMPVLLDCTFQVAPADSAGLGITAGSLKGQGIQNVFMHTSTTPGKGTNGQLNPNPAAGYIYVQLSDNYFKLYQLLNEMRGPLSGTPINVDASDAALTAHNAYVIATLGTTTAADWLALGVPPGIVPAVNVPFIAKVTGAGVGTGTVQTQLSSGITKIEGVGGASLALAPTPVGGSPNVGGWLLLECLAPTNSSTTTSVVTAPAVGTTIRLSFYLSQSSVTVAGE